MCLGAFVVELEVVIQAHLNNRIIVETPSNHKNEYSVFPPYLLSFVGLFLSCILNAPSCEAGRVMFLQDRNAAGRRC